MMKIFVSWSGETSHKVALILRDWLPTILEDVELWVSSEDINKGSRWGVELARKLEESSFGIICVDSSNTTSPWLNFEAGALSKSINNSFIIPFLFDITPSELKGPLAQFQVTKFDKEDIRKLVKSIVQSDNTKQPSTEKIDKLFDYTWFALKDSLDKLYIAAKIEDTSLSQKTTTKNETSSTRTKDLNSEVEGQILVYISETIGNSFFDVENIASSLRLPKTKVIYYLQKFEEKGWLNNDGTNTVPWSIKNGKAIRAYIVENNLI